MPRKHRLSKLRKSYKRRQSGGESAAYTFGSAVAPGAPYASQVVPVSACQAVARPGEIAGYSPPGRGGLPGFGGGGRRGRRGRRDHSKGTRRQRKTRGGGWTVNTAAPLGGPNVLVDNTRIRPCTFGGGKSRGSRRLRRGKRQGGGASLLGSPDLAAYQAQNAGYSNTASPWVSSVGAPVLLQQPYAAGSMNPACIKTSGGGKKRPTKRRKTSKKSWRWW